MAMNADDRLIDIGYRGIQVLDDLLEMVGRRISHGVRYIDCGRAGLGSRLDHLG